VTAAEQYVAAAYLVVFAVVLVYVLIVAAKLQRLEQSLEDLTVTREAAPDAPAPEVPPRPSASEQGQLGAVEAHL
jgi:CcmD family protein